MIQKPLEAQYVFNPEARLEHLNILREDLALPAVDVHTNDSSDTPPPSVGIEIEMTWKQAFHDMQDRWLNSADRPRDYPENSPVYKQFHKDYSRNNKVLRPILQRITPVIPRVGFDAYWEFSFRPTQDISVTSAELSTLYESGILFEDLEYATHMTIAGIPSNRDAYAILYALEQADGTTKKRLEAAVSAKNGSWSCKGDGGLRLRSKDELEGSDVAAYELRTLVTTSHEQMIRLLSLGQKLAQTCLNGSSEWLDYRQEIEQDIREKGLPLSTWGSPKENPSVWQKYGRTVLR